MVTANAATASKARKARKPPSPARMAAEKAVADAKKVSDSAKSPQEKQVAAEKLSQARDTLKTLRFTEVGASRINTAVEVLRRLENVANPATYKWTEEQARKAVDALEDGVRKVKDRLLKVKAANKTKFAF